MPVPKVSVLERVDCSFFEDITLDEILDEVEQEPEDETWSDFDYIVSGKHFWNFKLIHINANTIAWIQISRDQISRVWPVNAYFLK